ncbi:MAG: hypothetical protein M0P71_00755 [Melioribacteraceae bacterium]|nr:hypothetical protein [Melioribacteraceae bacterium]
MHKNCDRKYKKEDSVIIDLSIPNPPTKTIKTLSLLENTGIHDLRGRVFLLHNVEHYNHPDYGSLYGFQNLMERQECSYWVQEHLLIRLEDAKIVCNTCDNKENCNLHLNSMCKLFKKIKKEIEEATTLRVN